MLSMNAVNMTSIDNSTRCCSGKDQVYCHDVHWEPTWQAARRCDSLTADSGHLGMGNQLQRYCHWIFWDAKFHDVVRTGSTIHEDHLKTPHRRTVLKYQLILTRTDGDEAFGDTQTMTDWQTDTCVAVKLTDQQWRCWCSHHYCQLSCLTSVMTLMVTFQSIAASDLWICGQSTYLAWKICMSLCRVCINCCLHTITITIILIWLTV